MVTSPKDVFDSSIRSIHRKKGTMRKTLRGAIATALVCLVSATSAFAVPVQLVVDTSAYSGTAALLAFDFIDGGSPSNSATISSFTTDGALGASTAIGDASGALPGLLTLTDSSFFAEYLQELSLASQFTFVLDSTGNAPDAGMFPDGLSLFLLDPLTGLSLAATSDPTGANALLLLNVGQSNGLELYGGAGIGVRTEEATNIVPEPNSVVLAVTGFAALLLALRRRRR